jgi:hypothetical protein
MNPTLTRLGFTIGEKVINIDPESYNFKKTAEIVGFHANPETAYVFVKYSDGTFGYDLEGRYYLKVKSIP